MYVCMYVCMYGTCSRAVNSYANNARTAPFLDRARSIFATSLLSESLAQANGSHKHINESESNITHLIRFIHESAKDHTISGHPSACGLKII